MAMASPPPAGIYVPVPTFFASSTSPSYDATTPPLDLDTQGAHAVYLARAGITGLVVLGSTGESVHVHPRDRGALLRGVRERLEAAGFHDYPVVAGTATNGVEETVEQLVDARDAGAQWGLCLVPGYNAAATTQEGIERWFTAVADRSPIPVLIYHYPGVSNMVKVSPSTYAALAQHPNIVGCKLSHGDVSHLAQIALNPAVDASRFRVFTGLGQQLLPVAAVGCVGAIDGSAGFFPKSLVRLLALAAKTRPSDAEDRERRLLQFKVSCMEEIVVRYGAVVIKEAISRLRGFGDADGTRLPLHGGIPGGDAEWAKWKGVMDAMEEGEREL
ncbi:putative 4-hydroxy-2-oxoglutarate aldolase, mitochondrial [Tolypocladium ophioglossoides CBS 100239]|uniref:Putative 4-hydroxy-2-oxoglutarate aldolase, mitochondrial n=1 Tax=Tolypocladium ophioglossoides (strain CBS 100239) TaxID=1163406 RepID=A0A0L0MX56_TOLOC|nr:putative 4-hydroxy-2-oxoglutarate aldolase, mitochondrial [Tolypocladium ophioglossoides CBS 100239]